MCKQQSVQSMLHTIRRNDPSCSNNSEALTIFGLLVFAAALSQCKDICDAVVLKGGTVLRMLENGQLNRAPTKDLDASLLRDVPNFIERIGTEVVDGCNEILAQYFEESAIFQVVHIPEKSARRPEDAQMIEFKLKLAVTLVGRRKPTRAEDNRFQFEVSTDEHVDKALLMDFPATLFPLVIALKCYAPLQSLAEKLRAILQKRRYHENNIKEGKMLSAGNFPPRHVLDIETLHAHCLNDLHALPDVFTIKCHKKGIPAYMITRQYFDHQELWRQVKIQCDEYERDFERCQRVYWECVDMVLKDKKAT